MSRPLASLVAVPHVSTSSRQMGFAALREFVTQRPSLRAEAMIILLELTTHPGKQGLTAIIDSPLTSLK